MNSHITEANYPFEFRLKETKYLSSQINKRRNVVLTGMKRVGISNFLRYFLYHPGISKKYLDSDQHIFIPVDLNDLVEREIYPFWVLTFKRVLDSISKSELPEKIQHQVEIYFLDSIQSQDLFITIESLRKSLVLITENGLLPTIFFIRFDRIKDAITQDFYANLQGLIDATHRKLSCVFTSDRTLDYLVPEVFSKQSVFVFAENLYIKPANKKDAKTILDSRTKESLIKFSPKLTKQLLKYVDGHTQYLLFALISLGETETKVNEKNLFEFLKNDERISLQSEELWESLTIREQEILLKVVNNKKLNEKEIIDASYLINTGFFEIRTNKIFSPIFEFYILSKAEEIKKEKNTQELSKKELLLLSFLVSNENKICEREEIIESVWPESYETGVTDWAIDRLIARLRAKMTDQKKNYEIITIKTRGYKLIEKNHG